MTGIAAKGMNSRDWQESISESQRTCLRLVGMGNSSKEIAIKTGLSPRTVDQYVNQAQLTLGASNRRDAARILETLEAEALKKLQLKPERLAVSEFSETLSVVNHPSEASGLQKVLRWIPPVGGERHDLTGSETIKEIVKAAIIAAIGFGSIVAAGAWLQTLFN